MNPAKRFFVRMSLVTGSTLATIVGAQSLLALDLPTNIPTDSAFTQPSDGVIINQGPSLTVIRRSPQAPAGIRLGITPHAPDGLAAQPAQSFIIQPPAPIIAQPSVVMVPAQPRTRSSR